MIKLKATAPVPGVSAVVQNEIPLLHATSLVAKDTVQIPVSSRTWYARTRKNNPSPVTSQNQSWQQQLAHHLVEEATQDSTASVEGSPTTEAEGDYSLSRWWPFYSWLGHLPKYGDRHKSSSLFDKQY